MAKKISASDIFAEEDIFKGIKASAQATIELFAKLDKVIVDTAGKLKGDITGADLGNTKGINAFVTATQKATKAQQDAVKVDKIVIQAKKDIVNADKVLIENDIKKQKLAQETIKTNNLIAKGEEQKAKATEKAAKATLDEANAYKKLSNNTRDLKNESKMLAVEMLHLEQSGRKNTKEYRELAKTYKQVTISAQEGDRQLKKIDSTVGDNFRNVGNYSGAVNKLKNGLGQLGLAFGIGSIVQNAGKSIVEFDQKIADLVSITGAGGKDLEFYKQQAIEMGKGVQGGASAVIEAYKLIGSAKPELLNNAKALDAVTQSAITLSQASGMTLPDAATALTDAMNQFGAPAEKAGQFIDALANGALLGSAEIPQVTEALLKFGAIAKNANVPIEESVGLIETLAEKGLKGAEAGTALRNVMLKISAPDALPKEAQQRLQELGISFDDLKDKSKPFSERLALLKPLLKDNAAMVKVFGLENTVSATSLIQNTARIAELTAGMDKQGTASKQAQDRTKTLSFAFNELKESWNAVVLSFTSGEGSSAILVEGLSFIAKNLGTILNVIGKVALAWGTYKAIVLGVQAKNFLLNGGILDSIKGMTSLTKTTKEAGEQTKKAGDEMKNTGKAMTSIPWVMVIGLAIELANSFIKIANGTADAENALISYENTRKKIQLDVKAESSIVKERLLNAKKQSDNEIFFLRKTAQERIQSGESAQKVNAETAKKIEEVNKKLKETFAGKDLGLGNTIQQNTRQIENFQSQIKALENDIVVLREIENKQGGSRFAGITKDRNEIVVLQERIKGLYSENAFRHELIGTIGKQTETTAEHVSEVKSEIKQGKEQIRINEELKKSLEDLWMAELDRTSTAETLLGLKKIAKDDELRLQRELSTDLLNRDQQLKDALILNQIQFEEDIKALKEGKDVTVAGTAVDKTQYELNKAKGLEAIALEFQLLKDKHNLLTQEEEKAILEAGNNEEEKLKIHAEYNLKHQELDKEFKERSIKTETDITDKEKEALQKRLKTQEEFIKLTADYFIKRSNDKIAQMDKEIAKAENQYDVLQQLAVNGNINAQESLAEQQRIINEANARKEKEMKRQQRIKLAESVYSTYNSKVAAGSEHPLMDTIKDTMLLQQFIASLPTFYDGTEDTGKNGNGIDGKGGFHAVLHPNERVIPKSLNEQIGGLSNEALAKMASEYQNGKIIRSNSQIGSAFDTAILVGKLDELTSAIKQKPETNIGIGEITQSVMEIVKSTKQGNTTTYNRYKVRR